MHYNRLGKAGIRVSELSFGSWLTFGGELDQKSAARLMRTAFDAGVNFFDNAEVYANGESERLMGLALKDYRREDLVISTKIFWGGDGPNDTGLSWKHLVEGTKNSLKRLSLDYVDLLFCHRPDPDTPIEETVRAMDFIIRSGFAFYWGTSEWSADEIEQAFRMAERFNCIPPTMEQPQYNMLVRERMEVEYAPIFEKYGIGTTIWSPLASGALSGKYNSGMPKNITTSRQKFASHHVNAETLPKLQALGKLAKELGASMAQLALAWCLLNPNVSTVILGATSIEQLKENLGASAIKRKITEEVLEKINSILG